MSAGACSIGQRQWQDAEAEGQRGHNNGTQPQFGRFQSRLEQPHPFIHSRLGKLHDQDGVLGCQAKGGQQADLEVDVIGQSAERRGDDAADGSQGQRQEDGNGDRPALVKRGQAQEDHQDGKGVNGSRLRTGLPLLVG